MKPKLSDWRDVSRYSSVIGWTEPLNINTSHVQAYGTNLLSLKWFWIFRMENMFCVEQVTNTIFWFVLPFINPSFIIKMYHYSKKWHTFHICKHLLVNLVTRGWRTSQAEVKMFCFFIVQSDTTDTYSHITMTQSHSATPPSSLQCRNTCSSKHWVNWESVESKHFLQFKSWWLSFCSVNVFTHQKILFTGQWVVLKSGLWAKFINNDLKDEHHFI